ncbi:4-diphosphocytidyl-2-C-methyl-D-erythritol kinase [Cnuella takakiae]|uniref:4-diphosphocytidyl-2-C-methyl-D-erythritol kinase n=1 Tax=Cnuella takakiae TaxID=1302690 RepID=A0A1M4Y1G2_9BACT|nr:4-(cytidine 5'-diphospho)-2-C-methyl-D-erythritol kinase [Cnuella takakiae]OLY93019.1 4-(cytidine 5'-diphospho)-2-C-methyl-D-erythritol kinase [Cnuella takakiae]SHE99677.1 4-diphosphocytidyl-2-C-methyl-D-erythritol kinase [Cnuella takakiae]
MVFFPNCKINLGLHIKDKRPDGFHNLETIFLPVQLTDALEIIQSGVGQCHLTVTGITIDAHAEDNICVKAYRLLQQRFPQLPGIQAHLHKVIPSGAGLGGGSADGAFMLLLLNRKFNLGLTETELVTLALQLGSDCPFFILNKPCYATGRGEQMKPIALNLSGYDLVLVNPRIHVATGWAFGQLQQGRQHPNLEEIIALPVEEWKDRLLNDFEAPVFAAHPEIAAIQQQLYTAGASYAAMSGTGSTVYGLFKAASNNMPAFPDHYFTWKGAL